mgnify:CR=1 FL=1
MAYEDEFRIQKRGEGPEFRVSEDRTVPPHPLYDAPLDSVRNWANAFPNKNAHENIDSLIVRDNNKDFFQLMNSLMPWQTYPRAGAQMTQGFQEHGGLGQTLPAAWRGLLEQFTGEYDPVGYKALRDRKVKSIAQKHVKELFKK